MAVTEATLADYADRLASDALDVRTVLAKVTETVRLYNTLGISPEVAGLATDSTTVPGTSFDKVTMQNAYSSLEQVVRLLTGQSVTQGNHIDNIDKASVLGAEV